MLAFRTPLPGVSADPDLVAAAGRASRASAALVVAGAAAALFVWPPSLAAPDAACAGFGTVRTNTALSFALAGSSLWLTEAPRSSRMLAAGAALLALGTLAGPALATAVGLVLVSAALVLSSLPRRRLEGLTALLSLGVAACALLAGLDWKSDVAPVVAPMAMGTVMSFLLLSFGILAARPHHGIGRLATSSSAGGTLVRRLLPALIVVPCVLRWVGMHAQHHGWFGTHSRSAVLLVSQLTVFVFVTFWTARNLHETDTSRALSESTRRDSAESTRQDAETVRRDDAESTRKDAETVRRDDAESVRRETETLRRDDAELTRREAESMRRDDAESTRKVAETVRRDDAESTRKDAETVRRDGAELTRRETETLRRDDAESTRREAESMRRDDAESTRRDADIEESEKVSIEAIRVVNATLEGRVLARTLELESVTAKLQAHGELIEAIRDAQARFIGSDDAGDIFDGLLKAVLALTGSDKGYIHELLAQPDGRTLATIRATTDAAWSEGLCRIVEAGVASLAPPVTESVTAGGDTLVMPIHAKKELVGVIGLANSTGAYTAATVAYLVPLVAVCGTILAAGRVDDLRRAEEGLRLANAELVHQKQALAVANEELEAFSYSVSHDLRAPLRGIDGFSRVLLDEYAAALPDDAVRMLGIVRAGAQQMGHLIDDLLTFSRLSRHELATREVDIAAVFRGVVREINAEGRGPHVDVAIGALPPCLADSALLRQVIRNLLSNAVKYTRKCEVRTIEVGAKLLAESGEQEYFVRDNGVGFDMKYADKLFGVFQRMHRSEDYEGTGVGLAIVARIVHRHGGRIWAESRVDHGSTFHFTLAKGSAQ